MSNRLATGAASEERAAAFLTKKGLKLLERNYRCRSGEIDLICRDGAVLVFVEVRLRGGTSHGGAGGSITAIKQRRIVQAARHWLAGKPEQPCRFDAVLLDGADGGTLEWIKGAFDVA